MSVDKRAAADVQLRGGHRGRPVGGGEHGRMTDISQRGRAPEQGAGRDLAADALAELDALDRLGYPARLQGDHPNPVAAQLGGQVPAQRFLGLERNLETTEVPVSWRSPRPPGNEEDSTPLSQPPPPGGA